MRRAPLARMRSAALSLAPGVNAGPAPLPQNAGRPARVRSGRRASRVATQRGGSRRAPGAAGLVRPLARDGSSAPLARQRPSEGPPSRTDFVAHCCSYALVEQTVRALSLVKKTKTKQSMLNRLLPPLREGPWGFLPFSFKGLAFDAHWYSLCWFGLG